MWTSAEQSLDRMSDSVQNDGLKIRASGGVFGTRDRRIRSSGNSVTLLQREQWACRNGSRGSLPPFGRTMAADLSNRFRLWIWKASKLPLRRARNWGGNG